MVTWLGTDATYANYTVYAPNVWGNQVNDIMRKKLVLANFFVNRSDELRDGGKTLETPNVTELSASAKTVGSVVTLTSATETKVTLTVDQWYEVSFLIEDYAAAQFKRSYYLQEKLAQNAAYTIAAKLDTALATLFSGFSQTTGVSSVGMVDSDIRKAIGLYEAGNFDPESGAFFIDKKVIWNSLMGIDKFTLAINTNGATNPIEQGAMGKLYGYTVYGSNNITTVLGSKYNALANKDSLHWATSPLGVNSAGGMVGANGVRLQSNYVPELLGTLVTADIVYGVIENRDAGGILMKTKTY